MLVKQKSQSTRVTFPKTRSHNWLLTQSMRSKMTTEIVTGRILILTKRALNMVTNMVTVMEFTSRSKKRRALSSLAMTELIHSGPIHIYYHMTTTRSAPHTMKR